MNLIGPGAADTEADGRVLIVEDDPDMRALVAITMRNAGWQVLEAASGHDGIALALEALPDVIVCDRMMPGLDGLEVIAALAADATTEAIPVVLVTGLADVSDVVRGIDAGAHDYVVKPFQLIELQVRCRAALRVSRAHRRLREAQVAQEATATALAESEARYRALLDHLPDAVAVVYDRDLKAVVVSGAGMVARGFVGDQMVGRHFSELVSPVDVPVLEPLYRAAFDGEGSTTEFVSHATGVENLLDVVPISSSDSGVPDEILVVARDIGPLKQRERLLAAAEARWREAFASAPVGMAQLTLDGRFAMVNSALGELLGVPTAVLETMSATDIVLPQDVDRVTAVIARLAKGESAPLRGELQNVKADGCPVWTFVSVVPIHGIDGSVDHLLAHYLDISDRKRHESELEHLADHDALTGLLNRRGFEAALERHAAEVARYGPRGALVVLDIDGLKQVNDTLGHETGDALLVDVSSVLRDRLRASDLIGRLGGDEFAVVLPHATAAQAEVVAGAIVRSVRDAARATSLDASASVGVAMFEQSGRSTRELLAAADAAMYVAKTNGGNSFARAVPDDVGRGPLLLT